MNSKMYSSILILMTLVFFCCNDNPKIITETSDNNKSVKSSGIFSEGSEKSSGSNSKIDFNNGTPFAEGMHKVVVNEVLPTSKYVYLNINEGDKQYWIATRKMEAKVGESYFYKGGLLKTNFESKEYNRVFDTVYLVTNLVAEMHGYNSEKVKIDDYLETKQAPSDKVAVESHTDKVIEHQGSIKISELVENKAKYEGKTVQLTGMCTKINAGIMDRNWIHLKDGSKDDFDLVVTSDAFVPEGTSITLKALVTLDKDFGAGYRYDLILENGVLIK